MSTAQEITDAITHLDAREQILLIKTLPEHLKVPPDDAAWTALAESSFAFWDNAEDAIYDDL